MVRFFSGCVTAWETTWVVVVVVVVVVIIAVEDALAAEDPLHFSKLRGWRAALSPVGVEETAFNKSGGGG